MNWQEFRCRCSAIKKMMSESRANPTLTEKQANRLSELENKSELTKAQSLELSDLLLKKENSKKIVLSDTCIEYLMQVYAWETEGMLAVTKEMDIEQAEKGKDVEQESIELLSIVNGEIYNKNEEVVMNDYLKGTPDIFVGEHIMKSERIIDIKSVWDYPGFLKKINSGIDNGYTEQIQGYCDITGATSGEVAYCLVSMPEYKIMDYKKRLFFKGLYISEESPEFLEKWEIFERSMIFDSIPHHKRVFKVQVNPFTDFERQKVYDKVKVCRDWLCTFDEMYSKLNK